MAAIAFKRGDNVSHQFIMPSSSWTVGGTLFFTAKPAVDDDTSDALAVINKSFSDSSAVDDGTNVTYTCNFVPADTNSIVSGGESSKEYLAEFQWVGPGGTPVTTFPGNDRYLDAVVYFDIRRSTT